MLKLIAVLPLMLGTLVAFPQQDSIVAAQFLTSANDCLHRNQPDSARVFHRAALDIYQKSDRLDWWLGSYITMAYAWVGVLNRPFDAEEILDEALHQKWREPRNTLEWEQFVRVLMYKGHFYKRNIFDYSNAAKYYEESFHCYVNQLGEHNDKFASYIYHQLGNVYTRLGDYTRAENLLRRGIEYGIKYNKPEIGRYGDLAIIFLDLGKNAEALEVCQSGLKVPNSDEKTLITTRLSEARALLNLGNKNAALASLSNVIPLVNRLDPTDHPYYLAGYYAMSAVLQESLGNTKAALDHFQKVIRYETLAEGTPLCREVGKAHCELGDFYMRQHKITSALHE